MFGMMLLLLLLLLLLALLVIWEEGSRTAPCPRRSTPSCSTRPYTMLYYRHYTNASANTNANANTNTNTNANTNTIRLPNRKQISPAQEGKVEMGAVFNMLRIDSRNNCVFNTASTNARKLCRVQKHQNTVAQT